MCSNTMTTFPATTCTVFNRCCRRMEYKKVQQISQKIVHKYVINTVIELLAFIRKEASYPFLLRRSEKYYTYNWRYNQQSNRDFERYSQWSITCWYNNNYYISCKEKTSKDLTVLGINLCEIIFYKHMWHA